MLSLQQLVQATSREIRDRSRSVTVSGIKQQYRHDWLFPDHAYANFPGAQEISFVTIASDSKTDRRFRTPYRTMFRFPLNLKTGRTYAASTSARDLPCWVHCTCPAFQYYSEVAVTQKESSDIISSDGSYPRVNNPSMIPHLCKHLFAAAQTALKLRPSINPATADVAKEEPGKMRPRNRNSKPRTNRMRFDSDGNPLIGTNASQSRSSTAAGGNESIGLPDTWLGRLMYILFAER